MATSITVHGKYQTPGGTAASGYIEFVPRVEVVVDVAGGVIKLGTVAATLDGTGNFSVSLQASDDPSVNPTGWTYEVREHIYNAGHRSYDITVPVNTAGGSLDLTGVSPAPAGGGLPNGPVASVDGRVGNVILSDRYDPIGAAAGLALVLGG